MMIPAAIVGFCLLSWTTALERPLTQGIERLIAMVEAWYCWSAIST